MRECSGRAKEAERVLTILLMDKYTKANGTMEKYRGLEYANGQMVRYIKVIGLTIKRMVKESTNGRMEDSTEDIIEMIKGMDRVLIFGSMEESMLESGKMIKDMEKVSTSLVKLSPKRASGKKTKESSGLMSDFTFFLS